jgi:hemolysin D
MTAWACIGELDIVSSAEGRLVPQTLLKVVQPAEAGVVREILVKEGQAVSAGQVLVRLDPTFAKADIGSVVADLDTQRLHERRLLAELSGNVFTQKNGDNYVQFLQVQGQFNAKRKAIQDALDQEQSLLAKTQSEHKAALQVLAKFEQSLPSYEKTAAAYQKLETEGFVGNLMAAEKQRDAKEKFRDLQAQRESVQALVSTIDAQRKRMIQIQSGAKSESQKELAEVRAKMAQLQPALDKQAYRQTLMELKAPQAGIVKDLSTTTEGAVVQPGNVLLTLLPKDEPLFADVAIPNEEVGFLAMNQTAQIKFAAFPFQKYGLLTGKVVRISPDAEAKSDSADRSPAIPVYRARVSLDQQQLIGPNKDALQLTAGMQVVVEIKQGKRTVMEYLMSPVNKSIQEAAREK